MKHVGEKKSSLSDNTSNDKAEERGNDDLEDHDVNNDDSEHDDGGDEDSMESDEREEVSEEGEGEEMQTHLDTLSSLYEQWLSVARLNPDGSYTESFRQLTEKIGEACDDFCECWWELDDDQKSTAIERLLRSGVFDLLCAVLVEGLGSHNRTSSDYTTTNSLLGAMRFLAGAITKTNDDRKLWRRVRDDGRLLPVLLETLRDWYRPHMDNTATASQNEILTLSLQIIRNTAWLNDTNTADRLCQLRTTDVLVNYLQSADKDTVDPAASALGYIVTEREAARLASANGFCTTFCEMVRRGHAESAGELTKNTAICWIVTQEGSAVTALVERVRQTDDAGEKWPCLRVLCNLCEEQHQSMRTADKEQILELAVTQYRSHIGTHIESGRCRESARDMLTALRDDLERTPQYRQLCIELGFQPVDGGTGGRKRKLGDDQTTSVLNATDSDLNTESSTALPPSPKRQTNLSRDQPELAVTTASPMLVTAPSPMVVNLPSSPDPYDDELRAAGSHALSLTPGTLPAPTRGPENANTTEDISIADDQHTHED